MLLNNAGIATLDGKPGTSWEGADAWRKVFDVNVFGMLNVQHTFVPVRARAAFRTPRGICADGLARSRCCIKKITR